MKKTSLGAIALASALVVAGPATAALAETAVDTVKPVVTLDDAPAVFNGAAVDFVIHATDDVELTKIVGNLYKDGVLFKSTQVTATGLAGTHTVDLGSLADGAYSLKYNARDAAGNVAQTKTFDFVIDNTAPTVTVKAESVASAGRYKSVSFKLFDAGKIDKVEINGFTKDLSNNAWSDVNGVKPGSNGAVEGTNTLVAYDVAGNAATVTFVLDTTGPVITVKPESLGSNGFYREVSFKLHDPALVDLVVLNGQTKDLSNNAWSDLNGVKPGTFGAVEGLNTLVAQDALGNTSTVDFTVDTIKPVLTLPVDSLLGPAAHVFAVSQVEANPARFYVEIQQLVDGKWKKFSGKEFTGVNAADFSVDALALGLVDGVATQLKVSTWDKAGNQTSATAAVTVDLTAPRVAWQKQPLATYGAGEGFHVRPITSEAGTAKAVYLDVVSPETLVFAMDSAHKNLDTTQGNNPALWASLADGEHVFVAVFTDPAGNSTVSTSNPFVVARTAATG